MKDKGSPRPAGNLATPSGKGKYGQFFNDPTKKPNSIEGLPGSQKFSRKGQPS